MSKEVVNDSGKSYQIEEEIDLVALAMPLWIGRKIIIKTIFIFMLIGLFIAIFSEKEYTATTTIVPQAIKKAGGNLGGLAAIAGINLGSTGGGLEVSPELYPQIINSIPFQLELLQVPLSIKGQKEPITYKKYYTDIYSPGLLSYLKKYTIGLPGVIVSALKEKATPVTLSGVEENSQLLYITAKENLLIKQLSNQISINVNTKDGFLTLSVNMPQALAAAELIQKIQELLQQYVINFKIKKSNDKLQFIKERYLEKEKKFKTIQQKLAFFRDSNQNLSSAITQTRLEVLKSEYNLAFSIYTELSKQVEAQQIQVKEDTPVFTIIEPVYVPLEAVKPKRKIIFIAWMVFGIFVGIGLVLGRKTLAELKEKWNEELVSSEDKHLSKGR